MRSATASEGDKEVEEHEVSGQCALKGSAGATASPLPLLPIHPAYSMALDWKAGEGLSVTTRPPAGQDQTFPLGFLFLNQLGLGQNPSPPDGVASVPMWPVATFHERWERLADQMATLFLTSGLLAEIDSRQAPQAIDVRLDIDSSMLSQFPWEFVRRPEGEHSFLSAVPGVRHVYRSVELPGGDPSTIRWVQSVIRLQFDRGIEVDGADSPRLRNAIQSFQAAQGLEVTGLADAKTRWALDRSRRAAIGARDTIGPADHVGPDGFFVPRDTWRQPDSTRLPAMRLRCHRRVEPGPRPFYCGQPDREQDALLHSPGRSVERHDFAGHRLRPGSRGSTGIWPRQPDAQAAR